MLSPTFRYVHPLFEIPADVQSKIFPDASLSVLEFLQFPIPIISAAATRQETSKFFSKHDPNIQAIEDIQKIPVPPVKVVTELVDACKKAVLSGAKSVSCAHTPSLSG